MLIIIDHNNSLYKDTAIVVYSPAKTGIESSSAGNVQLDIYPNPAANELRISGENLKAGIIDIYTLAGNKLQTLNTNGSQSVSLQVNDLAPGLYILSYTDKQGNFGMRRFVKN